MRFWILFALGVTVGGAESAWSLVLAPLSSRSIGVAAVVTHHLLVGIGKVGGDQGNPVQRIHGSVHNLGRTVLDPAVVCVELQSSSRKAGTQDVGGQTFQGLLVLTVAGTATVDLNPEGCQERSFWANSPPGNARLRKSTNSHMRRKTENLSDLLNNLLPISRNGQSATGRSRKLIVDKGLQALTLFTVPGSFAKPVFSRCWISVLYRSLTPVSRVIWILPFVSHNSGLL